MEKSPNLSEMPAHQKSREVKTIRGYQEISVSNFSPVSAKYEFDNVSNPKNYIIVPGEGFVSQAGDFSIRPTEYFSISRNHYGVNSVIYEVVESISGQEHARAYTLDKDGVKAVLNISEVDYYSQ